MPTHPSFSGIAGPTQKPSGGLNDDFTPGLSAVEGLGSIALNRASQREEQIATQAYDMANRDVEAELTSLELKFDGNPKEYTEQATAFITQRYSKLDKRDPRTQLGVTHHLGSVNRGTIRHTKTMDNRNDRSLGDSSQAALSALPSFITDVASTATPGTPLELEGLNAIMAQFNTTLPDLATRTYTDGTLVYSPEKLSDVRSEVSKGVYTEFLRNRALQIDDIASLRAGAEAIRSGSYAQPAMQYNEEMGMFEAADGVVGVDKVVPSTEERDRLSNFYDGRANDLERAQQDVRNKRTAEGVIAENLYMSNLQGTAVAERSVSDFLVVDADTIKVFQGFSSEGEKVFESVRLDGVDAIEFGQSVFGEDLGVQGRDFVVEWLKTGNIRYLRTGADNTNGRAVGYFLNDKGERLGAALIQAGFAYYNDAFGDDPFLSSVHQRAHEDMVGGVFTYGANFAEQHRTATEETQDSKVFQEAVSVINEKPGRTEAPPRPTRENFRSDQEFAQFEAREKSILFDNEIQNLVRTNTPADRERRFLELKRLASSDAERTQIVKSYNSHLSNFEGQMADDPYTTIFNMYPSLQQFGTEMEQMPPSAIKNIYKAELANTVHKLANFHTENYQATAAPGDIAGFKDALAASDPSVRLSQWSGNVFASLNQMAFGVGNNTQIVGQTLASLGEEENIPYLNFVAVNPRALEHLHPSLQDNISAVKSSKVGKASISSVVESSLRSKMTSVRSAFPQGPGSADEFFNMNKAVEEVAYGILAQSKNTVHAKAAIEGAISEAYGIVVASEFEIVRDTFMVPRKDWGKLTQVQQDNLHSIAPHLPSNILNDPRTLGKIPPIDAGGTEEEARRWYSRSASGSIRTNPVTGVAEYVLLKSDISNDPVSYVVFDDGETKLTVPIAIPLAELADMYRFIDPSSLGTNFMAARVPSFTASPPQVFEDVDTSRPFSFAAPFESEHLGDK